MKTIEISLSDCNGEAEPEADFQKRQILRHLKKLEKTLIKACESGAFSGGLEMVEKTLKKSSDKFCRRVVRTMIESRDVDCRRVRHAGPGCSFRGATRKTIVTGFGKVACRRRRFRNHLDESLFVADERLDLVDGYFTPLAARQLLLLYSRMPVREALDTAAALGPVRCAPSRLLALAKRFGAEWGEVREAALAQIRESEPMLSGVEQIMVQLDGAGIRRIEEKQGDGKAGRTEVQWREAANGVVCLLDAEGECLKTSYFSFMPESLKPSLKLGLTAEAGAAQERYPGAKLVAVADGAAELWAFLEGLNPDAAALDARRALQHLKKACNIRYGEGTPASDRKCRELRRGLKSDPNGAQTCADTLRVWQGNTGQCEAIVQVKNYFVKNMAKMNYAEITAAGHPIGSGKVEAANKLLVSMRMKRCGQEWTQEEGQAAMDLRSLDKSGRFEAAWEHVMKAFKPSEIRFAEPVSDLPLAA